MDDQYHNLSLRLYEILDRIGASEEIRNTFRETAIVWEINKTKIYKFYETETRLNFFIFGSSCEGTTTPGLQSDIDMLCSYDALPVVEWISDAPQHGLSLLMVSDETTKPGYVKLQCVDNKVPRYAMENIVLCEDFETDKYGRVCIRYAPRNEGMDRNPNSPASTRTGVPRVKDTDFVIATRCQHIPSYAKSWLKRVIRCKRLNETQIHRLIGFGCFFVRKNHPSSKNGPIEWRLSFSLQERELMASLNSTQHKCYILLKIIKKDIIQKREPGSISSYYLKTCILFAVETTPCAFWTCINILKCTLHCIKLLLHWVKEQHCPNYFMQNKKSMFDRLECSTLRKVQFVLEDIAEQWRSCLWSLTCDGIGKVLHDVMFGCKPSIIRVNDSIRSDFKLKMYAHLHGQLTSLIREGLTRCKSRSSLHSLSELYFLQTHLLSTECVRDHTERETTQAIRYFIPHIRVQIAQCVASIILTIREADQRKMSFDTFKYYIEGSKGYDVTSACLIVASYYLQNDIYDVCENILRQGTSLKSHVLSVCRCRMYSDTCRNEAYYELIRLFGSQSIPYMKFARTCTTVCLAFLPCQANLVPQALHYEMYRSVRQMELTCFWFNWIVVDSKVYLYFLQYVLYSKTNKPVLKKDAIDNLVHVIATDLNLGHKETALNLLGWMFKQEHEKERAMDCFVKSWKIRENHNAAIWHALVLIHSTNRHDSDNHVV